MYSMQIQYKAGNYVVVLPTTEKRRKLCFGRLEAFEVSFHEVLLISSTTFGLSNLYCMPTSMQFLPEVCTATSLHKLDMCMICTS